MLVTSLAEAHDILLDFLQSRTATVLSIQIATSALECFAVGHYKGSGVGTLVVVEHHLVDGVAEFYQSLLNAFGAVFFSVAADEQTLEAAQHIEQTFLAHISQVARVEPSVAHSGCCSLGILPVSGHHVFALDHYLTLFAQGKFLAFGVADAQLDGLHQFAAAAQTIVFGGVGTDDGSGFAEAVALIHRQSDADVEALQILVEQCSSADEEAQLASETLSHLAQQQFVKQRHKRLEQQTQSFAVETALAIIEPAHLCGNVEEALHLGSLLAYALLDVLLEALGQCRYREDEVRFHLADIQWYVLQSLHGRASVLHGSHRCTLHHHHVEAYHVGKAMVEGQYDERAPGLVDRHSGEALFHVGSIVAVCQTHAFRVGCSAAGVGYGGDVGVLQAQSHALELVQSAFCQALAAHLHHLFESYFALLPLVLLVEHNHALYGSKLLADSPHLLELHSAHHYISHIAVLHAEEQVIALLQFDAQGYVDGTGIEHGQFAHYPQVASL